MASLSPEYQEKLEAFQKLSTDIRALVSRHQQFEAQLNENSMVKEELDNVKDEQSVFKMHGKVLIRQDIAEARSTVNSRIKLIQTEIAKTEKAISDGQAKQGDLRNKLMEMQQKAAAQRQA